MNHHHRKNYLEKTPHYRYINFFASADWFSFIICFSKKNLFPFNLSDTYMVVYDEESYEYDEYSDVDENCMDLTGNVFIASANVT